MNTRVLFFFILIFATLSLNFFLLSPPVAVKAVVDDADTPHPAEQSPASQSRGDERHHKEKDLKESDLKTLEKEQQVRLKMLKQEKKTTLLTGVVIILVVILMLLRYNRYRIKADMGAALTEEIRAHQVTVARLRESEDIFRIMAEKSVVGIFILRDHVIRYVNPAFCDIFGLSPEGAPGLDFSTLVALEDRAMVREKIDLRADGIVDSLGYEFRGCAVDGGELVLNGYGGRIHYHGHTAVLGTVVDITQRKKTGEHLLKSRKLESIGILAGGISHDFNNLLAVLTGYVEMLKDDLPPGTPGRRAAETIENAASQAADLAQQLNTLSKGGWLLTGEVAFGSVLQCTLDTYPDLASLLEGVSIPGDLRCINGDERQLRLLLLNLLRNTAIGRDTTPDHAVRATITAENTYLTESNDFSLEPGEYVLIHYRDNNVGAGARRGGKVFDPYHALSVADNSVDMPVGLELPICYSIVKKHRGHIFIPPDQGDQASGTALEILLPVFSGGDILI